MQSFIQYRRLGQRVSEQLERDRPRSGKSQSARSNVAAANKRELEAQKDLEKGAEQHERNAATSREMPNPNATKDVQSRDMAANAEKGLDESSTAQQERETNELERRESVESAESASPSTHEKRTADEPEYPLGITLSRATTASRKSQGMELGYSLTGIDVRDRTTNEGDKGRSVFVVGFEGPDDPNDPHNWSTARRWAALIPIASIGFIVGFASSIDSSILRNAAAEFHVSDVVESMATGLFLIGFGVGGLLSGPISETVGRNPVYIFTLTFYMIFIMASGLAPNIGAQLAFRFIAGIAAATPLTNAGGSVADLFNSLERVYSFPLFANAAFMGPILGPVVGGFIADSPLVGWRWTEWITLILSGGILAAVVLIQPETFSPILLKWKAEHLRRLTGDDRYCAAMEIRQETLAHRLTTALYRPFMLTFQEPIILLVALYLTVIYIILFTFLDGYDYIFGEIHGLSPSLQGLCFLGIAAGLCFASALVPLIYKWAKEEHKKMEERGNTSGKIPPEFRLWFSMLGGAIAIPVSLFWMGWTSDSNISLWSPIVASVFFGYGVLCVFISSYQYIIDSYEIYAASALASVTLLRYMAAGGMVIVGIPFYQNLGVHYTCTILACISALMVPVPYVFYFYGPSIRKRSKYAINFEA